MIVRGTGLNHDLHKKVNIGIFKKQAYEHIRSGVTAHTFNVDIETETANCDLDMADIGYTSTKWRMLQTLYLDYEALGAMCARLLHYKGRMAKSKPYVVDIGMNFRERRNKSGSCLMAITIGYNATHGWHAQVFTRASELTVRWYVDLIFIHVLIREIGNIVGFTPDEVKVFWRMATTYQSITSMPLVLCMYGYEDFLAKNLKLFEEGKTDYYSWTLATIKRYRKCYIGNAYQNYRVQRRPAEAYRAMKGLMEPKKSMPVDKLRLNPIEPYIRKAFENYDLEGGDDE